MTTKITQNMIANGAVGLEQLEQPLTRRTAQATTSGTAFDFDDIPSWVSKIDVLYESVSLSATGSLLVQIGDSGGIEDTGYVSRSSLTNDNTDSSTSGFIVRVTSNTMINTGILSIRKISGNKWLASGVGQNGTRCVASTGVKTLTGTLDRLRVTRTSTDTFTAGSVNIMYE